jgi:serine/threonine protein phosphatase PrpC
MGAEQSVDRKEAVELMDGTSSLTSADTSGTLASSESSDPAAHSLGDLLAPSLPNKCAVVAVDAHALMTSVVGSHALRVKGEDGLRVERLVIGGDVVLCAAIADGHGGPEAALFVLKHLLELLAEESCGDSSGSALAQAIERTFVRLHALLHADERHTAGTTVTVCLINETRGELTMGNVGDSAAFLVLANPANSAKPKQAGIRLTSEHRLQESDDERRRVSEAGGKLGQVVVGGFPNGPLRAFPGGVCCARAIGDSDCGPWLSPVPDTKVMPFPEAACVLIASDGVWDALPCETVIKRALKSKDVHEAAKRIVDEALRARGMRDDITCVCIVGGRKGLSDAITAECPATSAAQPAHNWFRNAPSSHSSYRDESSHGSFIRRALRPSYEATDPNKERAEFSHGSSTEPSVSSCAGSSTEPSVKSGTRFAMFAMSQLMPSSLHSSATSVSNKLLADSSARRGALFLSLTAVSQGDQKLFDATLTKPSFKGIFDGSHKNSSSIGLSGLESEVHSDCLPDCTLMASNFLTHHLAGALRNGSDRALAGPQAKAGPQPRWRQDHHQGRPSETPRDDHRKDIQPRIAQETVLGMVRGRQKRLRHPQHQSTIRAPWPLNTWPECPRNS